MGADCAPYAAAQALGAATHGGASRSGGCDPRREARTEKAGRSVCFCTLAELLSQLARAKREGRLSERIRFFCRPALLIVDEIGYLPVVPSGGNLFFQLVNARYHQRHLTNRANYKQLRTSSFEAWAVASAAA